jgi:uncharacterized protein (DUF58 family)
MKTTREGRRFVLAAFLIAVAAVNTGNNLIYLILALMCSVTVLSVVLLKINLHGLAVEVSFDGPVFAKEPAYASVVIRNRKRFVPSYSFRIAVDATDTPVYCGEISPGGVLEKTVRQRFERRGIHGRKDFFAESGFPFILLRGRRAAGASGEIVVYPAIIDVGDLAGRLSSSSGPEALVRSSSGDEIYSIRQYRYGDDRRRIHWKATAKTADLMVKEYAAGEYKRATIVIDNLGASGEKGAVSTLVFEQAVSLTASLAKDMIDRGFLVRVMSCRKVAPFGSGRDHLYRIFDILAVLGEEAYWDSPLPDEEGFFVTVLRTRRDLSNMPFAPMGITVYADSL